jgi:hypothetical protein
VLVSQPSGIYVPTYCRKQIRNGRPIVGDSVDPEKPRVRCVEDIIESLPRLSKVKSQVLVQKFDILVRGIDLLSSCWVASHLVSQEFGHRHQK